LIAAMGVKSEIDRVFSSGKAEDAYSRLNAAGHLGKIAFRIPD
jgi:hypothetical protein